MPVASKTRPLYFSPSAAALTLATPRLSSAPVSALPSRPLPPVATVPSTTGAPSVQRSSGVGVGEAEVLDEQLADGLAVKDW